MPRLHRSRRAVLYAILRAALAALLVTAPILLAPIHEAWAQGGATSPTRTNTRGGAARSGNPILPGWYADPEAHVFDGEYWIFPTYSAPYDEQLFMDAFSSRDLVNWTKHPRVLSKDNVPWARRAMWAPSIVEKDGWYYLFFGANDIQADSEPGGIGVARARTPAGPFKDYLGRPLIDRFHNGAQPIDQMVFQDTDGAWYIVYGGWRHCNIARLNDDFSGFVPFADGTTFKEITPTGYVEGAYMLLHDGKYYFMWSEGGWTGPDYAVAYAIGNSPLGPFERVGRILQQDPAVATGAGHHSVIQSPTSKAWYIVYHRRPLGETDRNHRAVSIDRLQFDANGRIAPVKITHEGVAADPSMPPAAGAPPTAREVIDRLVSHLGFTPSESTVDTWKAGDPSTPVTGVAVTMMATLDVLQRAAAQGLNLVITHEPTFYDHLDPTEGLVKEHDAVTAEKLKFIADHHMVVWRFHDGIHRMRPDMILSGVASALGWTTYQDRTVPNRIRIPATSLAEVARQITDRLGAHALRVVGDSSLQVTDIALIPGAAGFGVHRFALQQPGVQLLVIGEAREWETMEYVDDAVAAGQGKALIAIGHIPSEQPGMEDATRWLAGFVREVPVRFVAAQDPFWRREQARREPGRARSR